MGTSNVVQTLVAEGKRLFDAPPQFVEFLGQAEADSLLNDLDGNPHAFVIACIMDRQMKAERAFAIPYRISQKLGTFDFDTLAELPLDRIRSLMSEPEPLHRYAEEMSNNFYLAVQRIRDKYDGNAAHIWGMRPSSADVVYRFLEFRGVGPKIATMATNILARDFKIPLSDHFAIDISADVHVKRVFCRLGLTNEDASTEAVIYRAKALYPEFPGLLDYPVWEIGRNWCRPTTPQCDECFMRHTCPSANNKDI